MNILGNDILGSWNFIPIYCDLGLIWTIQYYVIIKGFLVKFILRSTFLDFEWSAEKKSGDCDNIE